MGWVWYPNRITDRILRLHMCGVCNQLSVWEKIKCGKCKRCYIICIDCQCSHYRYVADSRGKVWYTWLCKRCSNKEATTFEKGLQRVRG